MALEREENIKGTTVQGIAVWPHLNEPDYEYNADGTYEVKLQLEGKAAKALIKKLDAFYKLALAAEDRAGKDKQDNCPYSLATDEDGNDIEGTYLFKFKRPASGRYKKGKKKGQKWTGTVDLWDSQLAPMDDPIWGGSEIRVSYEASPYCNKKIGFGISLRLLAVQVSGKLVTSGGESHDPEDQGFSKSDDGFVGKGKKAESKDAFDEGDDDAPEGGDETTPDPDEDF